MKPGLTFFLLLPPMAQVADDAAYIARSQQRMDGWEQDLADLRARENTAPPAPPIETLPEVDSDREEEGSERDMLCKVESEDESAAAVKLDPRPLRPRRSIRDERNSKEVWFTNFRKLESIVASTMDAAKELKEEKVVLENRTRELERQNGRLEAKLAQANDKTSLNTVESTREHEELLTLRAKYEKAKGKLTQLREMASQDHSELDALREQIVELRDANDGFEKHTNERQEKYNKVKAKAKGLRETIAQHEATIADLTVRVTELQESETALVDSLQNEKNQLVSTHEAEIRSLKDRFEEEKGRTLPDLYNISPASDNLFGFLSQDPSTACFMNHVLFLPGRTLACPNNGYLAFGPVSSYDPVRKRWTAGSDLAALLRTQRELFVVQESVKGRFVVYVGTYLAHPLHHAYPSGTKAPESIVRASLFYLSVCVAVNSDVFQTDSAIVDVAFASAKSLPTARVQELIRKQFPTGFIDVKVMGLELVEFNRALHDALGRRHGVTRSGSASARPPVVVPSKEKRRREDGEKDEESGAKKARFV
ncbi:SCP domain-containing protein [Mycena chlorophos]|uniref:SCP domain-containing protein n=1 Tax=Mycena chlorophos TaxID=658473 RepID=A0A8H6VTF7_MYCCL|nr:SCP domain-containing protein [Mycena chlorophos]